MRYLIIVLLLFIGCDDDPVSIDSLYGCTVQSACNFNPNATIFDDSCIYESEDCLGICGGDNTLDECGICDDDLTNNCIEDECGVWGGNGTSCNKLIRGYSENSLLTNNPYSHIIKIRD